MLKKYGWTGAFNVCTDFLDAHPQSLTKRKLDLLCLTDHPDARMSWDDARQLLAEGHEVYPHSCSHEDLGKRWQSGDHDLVRHEVLDSIASYHKHLGVLPRFFCCPHLKVTLEVRNLIRAEGVEMFNNHRPDFKDEANADSVLNTICRHYYEGRRHLDLMFHGIVAREGGYKPFADEKAFEAVLKIVARLEEKRIIKVVSYREAHHGPSHFAALLDRWDWLRNKCRRVAFKLVLKDKITSVAGTPFDLK